MQKHSAAVQVAASLTQLWAVGGGIVVSKRPLCCDLFFSPEAYRIGVVQPKVVAGLMKRQGHMRIVNPHRAGGAMGAANGAPAHHTAVGRGGQVHDETVVVAGVQTTARGVQAQHVVKVDARLELDL